MTTTSVVTERPDQRRDEDHQRQHRQGQRHVDEHRDRPIEPFGIGGENAEGHADEDGEQGRGEADDHADPGTPDHLGQHVAAEIVGAER